MYGLTWWLSGKESPTNVGNADLTTGLGRFPGGVQGNPLQYSCVENPHEQRSLAGYSPWSCKELDMTELSRHTYAFIQQAPLIHSFILPFLRTCPVPRRRQWHPTPVLLLGNSHGWRSLVGCSPWGHTELDTTEAT